MKTFIGNNLKTIGIGAIVLIASVLFIGSGNLFAKPLPEISEITEVSFSLKDGGVYEYTGETIEPVISELTFQNAEGQMLSRTENEVTVLGYTDNVEIGYATMEVELAGYNGSLVLTDAFFIYPGQVEGLTHTYDAEKGVQLAWDVIAGSEGYIIYRSNDGGKTFEILTTVENGTVGTYLDKELEYNTTYVYKVRAFSIKDESSVCGTLSEEVKQTTVLATPVLVSAEDNSADCIQLVWEKVEGATGYQIYRDGVCIKEITGGDVISYKDAERECGITYQYHIKAKQTVAGVDTWGKSSNTISGQTTPDAVKLNGSLSAEDTQVNLKWNKSAKAEGYEIYKGGSLVKKVDANTTSWSDSGVSKDQEYTYKVRPYMTVNGKTVVGSFSNTFTKTVVYVSNFSAGSGNLGGVTQYTGTRYVSGGTTPNGWDCSGFTQWALQNYYGVSIPRTSASQSYGGSSVSMSDRSSWQPGDILAYSSGGRVTHVALYIGDGQIMHALNPNYGTVVQGVDQYENWDSSNHLVAVRRYH